MTEQMEHGGPVASPEERVRAFISHWYAQWSVAQREMGNRVDFDRWGDMVSQVDQVHFVPGCHSDSRGSFSSRADYDPEHERVVESDARGDAASVYTETLNQQLGSTSYHVYDLRRGADGDWLIERIFTLVHPPRDPAIDPGRHDEILRMSSPDAALIDGQANLHLDENVLFRDGRTIELPHLDKGVVELIGLGHLHLHTGVLGILDLGYDIYDFEPLHRRVAPGEYPVEAVTIHGRVAGIRVRFVADRAPVRWCAANTPSGNGVYGVDAGNLAIFDVGGLLGLSRIDKERLFGDWSASGRPMVLSMTDGSDCVITSSGFGDGAYPAYWGLDEAGMVVSLYIDFMILVRETDDGAYVSV